MKKYSCHKISEGCAEAEAIVSKDHIMFYLMNPETGEVIEKAHDLEGRSVAKKVLIFPGGKGSSVVQADGLYQLKMNQNMPAGNDCPVSGDSACIECHHHGSADGG